MITEQDRARGLRGREPDSDRIAPRSTSEHDDKEKTLATAVAGQGPEIGGSLNGVGPGGGKPSAGRAGEIEAELFDLKLKVQESQEREKRLAERTSVAEERLEDALSKEHDLRIQIHRYAEFNRALKKSRPWRMIQFLRRLAGREW